MPRVINPTRIPAKISGCALLSRSVTLGSAESEHTILISHETNYCRSIATYVTTIPQRHRQTDGLDCAVFYVPSNTV